jgi:hypothetical protein
MLFAIAFVIFPSVMMSFCARADLYPRVDSVFLFYIFIEEQFDDRQGLTLILMQEYVRCEPF